MKRLNVRLPDGLLAEIDAAARVQNRSKADIVRERLWRGAKEPSRLLALNKEPIGPVDSLPSASTSPIARR